MRLVDGGDYFPVTSRVTPASLRDAAYPPGTGTKKPMTRGRERGPQGDKLVPISVPNDSLRSLTHPHTYCSTGPTPALARRSVSAPHQAHSAPGMSGYPRGFATKVRITILLRPSRRPVSTIEILQYYRRGYLTLPGGYPPSIPYERGPSRLCV